MCVRPTNNIDREFERFKVQLLAELDQFADKLPGDKQAEFRADLGRLLNDPELRASFLRSVFANDKTLPDVQNIRGRLRGVGK